MAPVIWGLDLAEIKWSKFKSGYMWNTEYHLRRIKFIVYQLAMIFCVVSESLGTAMLSDYIDQQKLIQHLDPNAYNYNNDYIGAASYNIWAGVFVAFIFGAAFFFDLFWPERKEDHGIRVAWKACAVMAVIFEFASAFTLTIITATHRGRIDGVSPSRAQYLLSQFHKDGGAPLEYRHDSRAVAAVVFVWPGAIFTAYSCALMFMSINNTEFGPGPKSAHARAEEGENEKRSYHAQSIPSPQATYSPAGQHHVDGTGEEASEAGTTAATPTAAAQ